MTKKSMELIQEIRLSPYGGAELFFCDVNKDGYPEIFAYQGSGVLGSELFAPQITKSALPNSVCLSAFNREGKRLWSWGKPNPPDIPYLSHAHESCVAFGDVNSDGEIEIALADGDNVKLLNALSGEVIGERKLPQDNFYIVQVLGEKTEEEEAALVVKNGEFGYNNWQYGQPLIGLNKDLKQVWGPDYIPGAGHHILILDLDGDGKREYLVGCCGVKSSGKIAWEPNGMELSQLDAFNDHVDYTDLLYKKSGELLIAFAGTSHIYLVSDKAQVLFARPAIHAQGCVLGKFRADSEFQLALYNDDGPIILYDPEGKEVWQRPTPLHWPLGMPKCCRGRAFHRNRPIVKFSYHNKDWIIFTDGGWPWGMDGNGKISLEFEPPANSKQPESILPEKEQADDLGYGFATKIIDWNADGKMEVAIYDRRYLWIFRPSL